MANRSIAARRDTVCARTLSSTRRAATGAQTAIATKDEHATVLAAIQGKAASRRPFGRPGRPLCAVASTMLVGTEGWPLRSNRGMADRMHEERTVNLPMSTRELLDR